MPAPAPSIIELKTFCAQALPAYMSPDAFVVLDALPRTSTDKVDYQALRARRAGRHAGVPSDEAASDHVLASVSLATAALMGVLIAASDRFPCRATPASAIGDLSSARSRPAA